MNNFIVFEGISGSGKTTVSKKIAEIIDGIYIKSPIDPFNLIRASVEKETNPISQYLFYLANLKHLSDNISKLLVDNSVIVDKYLYTTLAYNKALNIDVNIPDFVNLIMPDYCFLLEIDENLRLERIQHRDKNLSYRSKDLLETERSIHRELKIFCPIVVNNNKNLDETVELILKKIH